MSGHSKWATIHRQKEVNDSRRGQQFTKIANAITVAVRQGGGVSDPEANFHLRLAVEKARAVNMPKENIERAMARGRGVAGEAGLEGVLYEGYAPGAVGILVEAVTDNKQRTAQVIKNIFDRGGGSLAGPGAVSFLFRKMGIVIIGRKEPVDEQILWLIDHGASEVEEAGDEVEVYVPLNDLEAVKKTIAGAGYQIVSSEPVQKAVSPILMDASRAEKTMSFVDQLEELEDVQKVWVNAELV